MLTSREALPSAKGRLNGKPRATPAADRMARWVTLPPALCVRSPGRGPGLFPHPEAAEPREGRLSSPPCLREGTKRPGSGACWASLHANGGFP